MEDVGDVILIVFVYNAMYVEDVKDRSNTPKGCNPMYVGDVEDVKDRSNTPKGCNAMYSKMLKIDQIHLRAVMLCMSEMSKMGKSIHTHFGS